MFVQAFCQVVEYLQGVRFVVAVLSRHLEASLLRVGSDRTAVM